MYTGPAILATTLLLASGVVAAPAQSGVRGAGWRPAGDARGGGPVRVASPPNRPSDPRAGGWARGSGPASAGPGGWSTAGAAASRFHRRHQHAHAHHHAGCFGHHGLHVGAHFGSAFVILVGGYAAPTYHYAAPYAVHYSAGGATTLLQGNVGNAGNALSMERLAGGVVRLSWPGDGRLVDEVGLFLADAQQRVLAVQTLRAAPFAALFEPSSAAAYVGITVSYADGQNTTTLLPFRR